MIFENEADKFSYAIGMSVGTSLAQQNISDLKLDNFSKGFDAANNGKQTLMDLTEAGNIINEFLQKNVQAKAGINLQEGVEFLNRNKNENGIIELPSGLQYRIVKDGTGSSPKATDTVTVHYAGTLINGKEFDSSYSRNEPAQFPVNGVITGWTEALQLMKTGAEWELFIPSELAYGANAPGGVIEPNMVLVFKVELLKIN